MVFSNRAWNIHVEWRGVGAGGSSSWTMELPYLVATVNPFGTVGGRAYETALNLDQNIGYNGALMGWDFTRTGFASQVVRESIEMHGSVLTAQVRPEWWPYNSPAMSICFDFFVDLDVMGNLVVKKLGTDVRCRLTMLSIGTPGKPANVIGFAVGIDGRLHLSELNLDDHYENRDGFIEKHKNGHFSRSTRNIFLDPRSWDLRAEPYGYSKNHKGWQEPPGYWPWYKDTTVEDDGKMTFNDPPGFWDTRGAFFRFLEDLPVVGFFVAGLDELRGDSDEAARALAGCAYSTLVLVGTILGGMVSGPFAGIVGVGAAVGATLAHASGMYVKKGISYLIKDPKMRNEVGAVTVFKFIYGEFFALVGAGTGGVENMLSKATSYLAGKGLDKLTEYDLKKIVENLVVVIESGKTGQDAEDYLKHLFNDHAHDGRDIIQSPFGDSYFRAASRAANHSLVPQNEGVRPPSMLVAPPIDPIKHRARPQKHLPSILGDVAADPLEVKQLSIAQNPAFSIPPKAHIIPVDENDRPMEMPDGTTLYLPGPDPPPSEDTSSMADAQAASKTVPSTDAVSPNGTTSEAVVVDEHASDTVPVFSTTQV